MVIIALHYHCYDLFVCLFFMLKLLQYCNYIIIVMQINLMLLLLLLDKGLQWVTKGYKGLQTVEKRYKGLQRVTKGYKGLQGVTRGYNGLQRVVFRALLGVLCN